MAGGVAPGAAAATPAAAGGEPLYDVAVVGGGVVGCAVARELAGYDLSVALVEARGDVGDVTSKANTAIWHTGFDAKPGTLEARLVARGWQLLGDYAEATGIPLERTGAVLVAWNDDELAALPGLEAKARENGYERAELLTAEEVYARLPALGGGVLGGLSVPDEGIICPWSTTLALALDAQARGAAILLDAEVTGVDVGAERTTLSTAAGPVEARWVVGAAGLGADHLDRAFGHDRFTVTPRRGELIVYDKLARAHVDRVVLPVPTARGKGVLVSPTVYGNVMVGPTSEDLTDRRETATSEAGLAGLRERARGLLPALEGEEVTAVYAGLRAATEHGDYVVEVDEAQRYVCLGGIRSTGLTSSMALGEHVAGLLAEVGLALTPREDLPAPPAMPPIGEAQCRPYADDERLAADAEYGRIICFCERVSRGEIRDALASPLPPADLAGLRRRTRATMGRCQAFYCGAEVAALLAEAQAGGQR